MSNTYVERVDSVLISGACKLEKERLELKLLRFKGGCIFAHLQWTLNPNLTKKFLARRTSNLDLKKVFQARRTLNLKPFATKKGKPRNLDGLDPWT
jgi:hypothetical protein